MRLLVGGREVAVPERLDGRRVEELARRFGAKGLAQEYVLFEGADRWPPQRLLERLVLAARLERFHAPLVRVRRPGPAGKRTPRTESAGALLAERLPGWAAAGWVPALEAALGLLLRRSEELILLEGDEKSGRALREVVDRFADVAALLSPAQEARP